MSLRSVLGFIVKHPLNRGQRLRAIGRFLRWQFASRLLPFPAALPFVDRFVLLVERGMTGATGNYYCGLHEAEDMAFVLHFMRPGDVFYDIGANVGSYSVLAAATGAACVGFEPSTEASANYERNVSLNSLQDRILIHRVALGENVGELSFTSGYDTTNHVVADGEQAQATEVVSVRRFDEFFRPGRPSFIKMDVEGFEAQVLAGSREALSDPSLMGMLIEDNGSDQRYGGDGSVSELILAHGFAIFSYEPLSRTLVSGGNGQSTGNLLFLRDGSAACDRVRSAGRFHLVNGWI